MVALSNVRRFFVQTFRTLLARRLSQSAIVYAQEARMTKQTFRMFSWGQMTDGSSLAESLYVMARQPRPSENGRNQQSGSRTLRPEMASNGSTISFSDIPRSMRERLVRVPRAYSKGQPIHRTASRDSVHSAGTLTDRVTNKGES